MAEELDNESENQEEAVKKPSGNKKKVIIIALVVILAVVGSVMMTLYLLSDDESTPVVEAEEAAAEETTELPDAGPARYLDMKPAFLVTFNVAGRQRYMQASLSIMSRYPDSFSVIDHHMPLIRSKLISLFGAQDFSEIQTEAGKESLLAQSADIINEVLESEGQPPIERVLFTNFVMQ